MINQNDSPGIELITPREADIGGFTVRRSLPTRGFRSVGPWVFFDHMGPAKMAPGHGMDVISHPHINLATVTYLFDGEIVHRDSIGSVQTITPGAINLMMAGSGIVHSERTSPETRAAGHTAHGLQLWIALPEEKEEDAPAFYHYPAPALPAATIDGVDIRVMMGAAFELVSPVITFSPTLYVEAHMAAGALLSLPNEPDELAVYVVTGNVAIGSETRVAVAGQTMAVLAPTAKRGLLHAQEESRIALIGGANLGKRYMWWNFVSSRRERIEQAMDDWKTGGMGMVPGESEFTPLPESDGFATMKE